MKNQSFPRFAGLRPGLPIILALLAGPSLPLAAAPAVVLNEIHYHPVENAAFNADGTPVLDLSDDVHEFVELYNAGATNVPLAGWRLAGEVDFEFSTNAVIGAGGYLVIAKNPARLLAVAPYALNASNVLGPYQKNLSNRGGAVRVLDAADNTVDSVSYSAESPWAIGADALGADDEWTGLRATNFQYRGRSLERVSAAWAANDPANWLASPAPGNPSPGRSNAVTRAIPRPVVVALAAYQNTNGAALIRSNQPVRIDATFSATNNLSAVSVEYFLDNINVTNETPSTVSMVVTGAPSLGRFTAVLPGRADRTIVRYRIRANRGGGVEAVSPRADDPFAWHAYFVTPTRTSTNRIYDCFLSTASLNTLATNLNPANPSGVDTAVLRRITNPNPPGNPSVTWNATEPAVFVFDGQVYDARARYHGSQYRRAPVNNSWKWQFPRYKKFDDRQGLFISDNDDITVVCGALYRQAGVPQSYTRWIDFYLTTNAVVRRMDQDEMDDGLLERFFAEQRLASPELPREGSGEFYKSQGNFLFSDPTGPFGYGGYRILPARPPYWTELQRYEHTYGLQMNGWKGHVPFRDVLHGLWDARGDSPTAVNPNTNALRAWLAANFDVDATLTSMAIRVWCGGWDNFNHNHFLWRKDNGKWTVVQWDFDGELFYQDSSIYLSEREAPLASIQFAGPPLWVDANWVNDSFFKAFRQEYKRKLFLLNNTLLNPTNITALGFGSASVRAYADARFASVNSQLALGTFQRPSRPTHVAPISGQAALAPTMLVATPYAHGANPPTPHASTTWFLRAASGSYTAPVIKTTSTTNLTSLPIPFGQLDFGATYYWKCFYTDTNGHPSFESAETSFIYGAEPSFAPLIAIDAGTLWRFSQAGTNQTTGWKNLTFNDSAWLQGAALLADDTGPLPEPVRTTLTRQNRIAFYFRRPFLFSGDPAQTQLRLRYIVDDGVIIYLNGAEIVRTGMPAGNVNNLTAASRTVTDAVYEGLIFFPTNLIAGSNIITAEVHRTSASSPDVVFGLSLDATAPPQPDAIALNEIAADNRSAVAHERQHPDYLELFNSTAQTQSLNGMSLSDNTANPGKYVFPPNTSIEPGGFLIVWCDNETNAPGLHTGFALDNDGQTVALFVASPGGYVLGDSVKFGLQAPDAAIARVPDGAGAWQLAYPTAGSNNLAWPTAPPDGLKINEWMATDAGGPDWFELFNSNSLPLALAGLSLSDNPAAPAKSPIPPLSFIAAGGFRQFIADENPGQSPRHVNFKLSGGGETIGLYDAGGYPFDLVVFGPQVSGVSQGRLPDGADGIVSFPASASPEESNYLPPENVFINEVLAHSDPPLEDAVELFNPTDTDANIGGWWLSDDRSNFRKFRIPDDTIVPAHGFLVLYENQFNADPMSPTNFAFNSARGDAVYLSSADTNGYLIGYRASASVNASESGVSIGRFPTSQGVEFVALARPTFGADNAATVEEFRTGGGAANACAKVGPVVISEILYHPPDLADEDNARDEFIELRNITAEAVPLFDPQATTNRWRLRDAVDFTFPPATMLEANEAVLVVGFDPVADTNALAAFLDAHGPVSARLFGPWQGKLDNSSDRVELVKPDAPVAEPGPDYGYVPTILADKVKYQDAYPWPAGADGSGFSLMRRALSAYGNEPTNWFAWFPTLGRDNTFNEPPVVSLASPGEGAAFLGPTDILLTAAATDPDGSINSVEFFDGTNKLALVSDAPFQFNWTNAAFGPHTLTVRARDNGYATAFSAPVHIRVNSQPPVVALTSPAHGAFFVAGNVVALAATATDPDTPVAKVEFFVDGASLGEDLAPDYTASWSATVGPHALTAVATDSTGTSSTSAVARVYGQAVSFTDTVAIATGSTWKYLDNGSDQGAGWTNLNFSDGAWASGAAELGFGDLDEITVMARTNAAGATNITFYFRQKFTLASLADITAVQLRVLRDDGAIAYLNGAEVYRDNMPAGPVTFQTTAALAIGVPDEATFFPTNVNPARLVAGTNILAVEVHQASAASSDVSFNAELRITRTAYGPAIVTHPQSQTSTPGQTAIFTVAAIGADPLRYQWRFNGAPLASQTNDTLALPDVQPAQAGAYSVTVSNAVASVTSLDATLTLGEPDADGDGLPDAWEIAFGLDPLGDSDRDTDADGDHASNWAEYIAGTNPTNALSYLKIDSLSQGPAAVLRFSAAANTAYIVQFTDELGSRPWANLREVPVRATPYLEIIVDPATTTSRFYRLFTPQQPPEALRILSLTITCATTLTFNAVSNRSYTVYYKATPDFGPWSRLVDVPARSSNDTAIVSDPNSAATRFYRLVIPTP